MKTFKAYILENKETEDVFLKAKQVSKWLSEKQKQKFETALDNLATAAKNKEIYNARFSDYKRALSSGIEFSYRKMFDEIRDKLIEKGVETADLWSITSISDIKKVGNIYNKMNPKNPIAIEYIDSLKGLPDAMKTMKTYVKSGRPPKEVAPGTFIKPLAGPKATVLAQKFMKSAVSSFEKKLKEEITDSNRKAFDKIKDITNPKELPRTGIEMNLASMIFITRRFNGKVSLELKPNPEKVLQKIIDDSVENIISGFVYKNATKLALILQKKNEPTSHKILQTRINNGMLENEMTFEFQDKSSFMLTSSVIYKTSSQGKQFLQYPTRFKNVKMSDGTRMKAPSEEKMIIEF